jgi:hypothetical protein
MKILHFQIPLKDNARIKDSFAITPNLLGQFMNFIKEKVGNEFIVVASPCVPGIIGEDDILYNLDMKQITLKEIKELIKLPIDKNDTL